MKPIAPSRAQLKVLREIAGAGFQYSSTKQLCSTAGWDLVENEPDLGFIQYFLMVGAGVDDRRLLSIGTPELEDPPHIYLPLYYFPEDENDGRPEELGRTHFDDAYRCLADQIAIILGRPEREGTCEYSHHPDWPYHFSAWRFPVAQIFILQDEHDIQFGMDVSLWLFRPTPIVDVPFPL